MEASRVSDQAWLDALSAYPPRPKTLRWREGDFPRTSWGLGLSDRGEGEARHYGQRGASWLRDHEPVPAGAARNRIAMSPEQVAASEARRLEIVGAWDAWQADLR